MISCLPTFSIMVSVLSNAYRSRDFYLPPSTVSLFDRSSEVLLKQLIYKILHWSLTVQISISIQLQLPMTRLLLTKERFLIELASHSVQVGVSPQLSRRTSSVLKVSSSVCPRFFAPSYCSEGKVPGYHHRMMLLRMLGQSVQKVSKIRNGGQMVRKAVDADCCGY